ncbi:MAG: C39 family peptidase [Candidatus Cyclobacteriaceae bacterium M3_2C_046]
MSTQQINSDLEKILAFNIQAQPDDVTCGPTCLHAVYDFYNKNMDLQQVIREVNQLEQGGTLAVYLGLNALEKGYQSIIYTYNLQLFDPSWFESEKEKSLIDNLRAQMEFKQDDEKLQWASEAYIRYLQAGGIIKYQELNPTLIKKYLRKSIPILTGLSATYLYNSPREIPETTQYHNIKGQPAGHFVVINGFSKKDNHFYVSDPLKQNPMGDSQYYKVAFNRLISAILLGIVTYDANLLIIYPK